MWNKMMILHKFANHLDKNIQANKFVNVIYFNCKLSTKL